MLSNATGLCRSLAVMAGVALAVALAPGGGSSAQSTTTLTVLDWNIHHGTDTSGANNLDRVATWIAQIGAHVVSLNEVEKINGYNGNADEPAVLESLLEGKTGSAWYGCFAQRTGASTGQGNLVLSRFAIEACETRLLSASRSVALARIRFSGITVNVFSTHLDDASASTRTTQISELKSWAAGKAEQRLILGDFNAWPGATEIKGMTADYFDSWAQAQAAGTATAYAGNEAGNTRNSRIDYIWRSKGATALTLLSARVYDTGTTSDHRPVTATFGPGVIAAPSPIQPPTNVRVIR
jgi:endonuclease/exonuclease/phosphatase family metal-dependent hydrolase